ncbi:MAG: hypothetical protein PHR20_08860 [Bacteroidales bacterium]|nr:hypothetical protein [Bacteroidales bacterium]
MCDGKLVGDWYLYDGTIIYPFHSAIPAGVACAKNVLEEHDAVSEMKVVRLQTAVSCFSPKGCGREHYGKSRGKSLYVLQ